MSKSMQSIGEWGEELAIAHLRKLKFTILERNYHASYAEVDIIAMEGDVLVFVEVKTRHIRQAEVASVVSEGQRSRLAQAAAIYMNEIGHSWEIRFDLIEVQYHDRHNYNVRLRKDFFYPKWKF